jgi:hypothetical protein
VVRGADGEQRLVRRVRHRRLHRGEGLTAPLLPDATVPVPAKPRRTGRLLLILGLIVLLILAAGGVAAALANISLSNTYSPEKAVTDYLAAQKRGDFLFMFNNANYLRGAGSYDQFFDGGGIGALLAIPQNTDISDVRVTSTVEVDADTRIVGVTMTWAGHHLDRAFKLHRDLGRVHYKFYNSWRIDIPFASIHLTVPNQHGYLFVDGLPVPESAIGDIRVIAGFHKVTMDSNDLYDQITLDADTIDRDASVAVPSAISGTGFTLAAKHVNEAILACDAMKWDDCPNHLYHAPNRLDLLLDTSGISPHRLHHVQVHVDQRRHGEPQARGVN